MNMRISPEEYRTQLGDIADALQRTHLEGADRDTALTKASDVWPAWLVDDDDSAEDATSTPATRRRACAEFPAESEEVALWLYRNRT
jgi:hypothetical protein